MKKLILFDWGNVLQKADGHVIIDELAELCKPTDKHMFEEFIFDYLFNTLRGIKFDNYVANQLSASGCNVTVKQFKDLYIDVMYRNSTYGEVYTLAKDLKKTAGCKLGILSNQCILDIDNISRAIDLSTFDYFFLSGWLNTAKPCSEIYYLAEVITHTNPKDILFIDDNPANILTAKQLGWNTIQATYDDADVIREKCFSFLNT